MDEAVGEAAKELIDLLILWVITCHGDGAEVKEWTRDEISEGSDEKCDLW
jgi:hypothetical protein